MAKVKPENPKTKGWFSGGLSKEDKKYITDLGVKIQQQESTIATLASRVDQLTKVVEESKPFKIEVTCVCQGEGGGLSESQEQELAGKLSVETDALQGAVEANQQP